MNRVLLSFSIILMVSCQPQVKVTPESGMAGIKEACECKGRSGKSIDELLRAIAPEGSYDFTYEFFENKIADEAPMDEIQKALEMDFANNSCYCKNIKSIENMLGKDSGFSYEQSKQLEFKIDSMMKTEKKFGCFRFLPAIMVLCKKQ